MVCFFGFKYEGEAELSEIKLRSFSNFGNKRYKRYAPSAIAIDFE